MMFYLCKDHIWPDKILSVPYKDLIQIKVYLAIYGLDLVLVYIKVISAQFFIWARYKSHICVRYGPDIKSISGPYMEFYIWPISGFRVRVGCRADSKRHHFVGQNLNGHSVLPLKCHDEPSQLSQSMSGLLTLTRLWAGMK